MPDVESQNDGRVCGHSLGESVYDWQEAQAMRVKLIKLSEEIDILRSVFTPIN